MSSNSLSQFFKNRVLMSTNQEKIQMYAAPTLHCDNNNPPTLPLSSKSLDPLSKRKLVSCTMMDQPQWTVPAWVEDTFDVVDANKSNDGEDEQTPDEKMAAMLKKMDTLHDTILQMDNRLGQIEQAQQNPLGLFQGLRPQIIPIKDDEVQIPDIPATTAAADLTNGKGPDFLVTYTKEDFARMVPPFEEPIWRWAQSIRDSLELAGFVEPYPANLSAYMVPLMGTAMGGSFGLILKGKTLEKAFKYLISYDKTTQSITQYLRSIGPVKGKPSAILAILKHRIHQAEPALDDRATAILAFDVLKEQLPTEVSQHIMLSIFSTEELDEQVRFMDALFLHHKAQTANKVSVSDVALTGVKKLDAPQYLQLLDDKIKILDLKQKAIEGRTAEVVVDNTKGTVPPSSQACPCLANHQLQNWNRPRFPQPNYQQQSFPQNYQSQNSQQYRQFQQFPQRNFRPNFQQQNFQRFSQPRNALPYRNRPALEWKPPQSNAQSQPWSQAQTERENRTDLCGIHKKYGENAFTCR